MGLLINMRDLGTGAFLSTRYICLFLFRSKASNELPSTLKKAKLDSNVTVAQSLVSA